MTGSEPVFDGFTFTEIETSGARIRACYGGSGPPLLLLHGNPQTLAIWRHVAPRLAERHRVVCTDLRGYGFSSKPPAGPDHINYSKREMARDQVEVMAALGHQRFDLCGHDRGGRLAHRLAMDWPERVRRLAVLDIAPTREMYAGTTDAFARGYWHWFLMIKPSPLPELMMGADPDQFWRLKCGAQAGGGLDIFGEAMEEYLTAFRDPEMRRASCDDYRAAAHIDIDHDNADGESRLPMPLLALWGAKGRIEECFDCLALWRRRAEDVRGWKLDCGHFLPEEAPDEVSAALWEFFAPEHG
ncbi:MAG: alpha/beta hydrolase [Pseudomonadota bacterium]